jgi:amidohydrolase
MGLATAIPAARHRRKTMLSQNHRPRLRSALLTLAGGIVVLLAAPAVSAAGGGSDAELRTLVDRDLAGLVGYYQALHAAPELSRMEEKTSAQLAGELRAAGYDVTEHVGKYVVSGFKGYGVVGVLRNGRGPTLLIRADMDALPVEERTGLAYASTRHVRRDSGEEIPVMHACGHDIHVTSLVGVARVMAKLRDRWSGTLVLVGQPAEETIDGALAMLRDGLYERAPKPDIALALHDSPLLPAGAIGLTPGLALATSTQMDVLVRGVGGHGSRPEAAKDPVVLAANIVMQLQTIVSRETSPFDQAVVTVGTIHGGIKRNIIPDEVKLELNLRAYKEEVRQHLIEAVARISRAAALGAGVPEDRLPIVTVIDAEFAPALNNDAALIARLRPVFERALGAGNVQDVPPVMASEDFGRFGLEGKIPVMMFSVGASKPEALAEARRTGIPVPSLHSSRFAPVAEPTLRTGILAMTAAALELLGRP